MRRFIHLKVITTNTTRRSRSYCGCLSYYQDAGKSQGQKRFLTSSASSIGTAAAGASCSTGSEQHQQKHHDRPKEVVVARQYKLDRGRTRTTVYYAKDTAENATTTASFHKVEPVHSKDLQFVAETAARNAIRALLPRDYPRSVQKGYDSYVKLQMTASLASSAIGVLSTQALLYAMGLGAGSVPLAAALNWVIKDGIGQIGGIVFASIVNDRFDANPKRWKMVATISLDGACALELLAPLAPGYFLAIASLANIGKNVCFLSASASRAAIHNSFAKRENLADITAKAGSQFIVTSILGTGLGIILSTALGSSWIALAPICASLSFVHITCNYLSLRHVCLNTINSERLELIMQQYIATGRVPHPSEISGIERFMSPTSDDARPPSAVLAGMPYVRFSQPLDQVVSSPHQLHHLFQFFEKEQYLLNARGRSANRTVILDLLFKQGAKVEDVLKGNMHAYLARHALAKEGWKPIPLSSSSFSSSSSASMWRKLGPSLKKEAPLDAWLMETIGAAYHSIGAPYQQKQPSVSSSKAGEEGEGGGEERRHINKVEAEKEGEGRGGDGGGHRERPSSALAAAGGGGSGRGEVGSAVPMTQAEDFLSQLTAAGWLIDSVFLPHQQNRISLEKQPSSSLTQGA